MSYLVEFPSSTLATLSSPATVSRKGEGEVDRLEGVAREFRFQLERKYFDWGQ